MKSGLPLADDSLPLSKQSSQAVGRMSKTTRFADMIGQQDALPQPALSQSLSGIPTGASAHWMLVKLMSSPSQSTVLLSLLAVIVILLQVSLRPNCSQFLLLPSTT